MSPGEAGSVILPWEGIGLLPDEGIELPYALMCPFVFLLGEILNRSSDSLSSYPVVGVMVLALSCSVIAVAGPARSVETPELGCFHECHF